MGLALAAIFGALGGQPALSLSALVGFVAMAAGLAIDRKNRGVQA